MTPEDFAKYGENSPKLYAYEPTTIEPAAKAQSFFRDQFEKAFGDEPMTKQQKKAWKNR